MQIRIQIDELVIPGPADIDESTFLRCLQTRLSSLLQSTPISEASAKDCVSLQIEPRVPAPSSPQEAAENCAQAVFVALKS